MPIKTTVRHYFGVKCELIRARDSDVNPEICSVLSLNKQIKREFISVISRSMFLIAPVANNN